MTGLTKSCGEQLLLPENRFRGLINDLLVVLRIPGQGLGVISAVRGCLYGYKEMALGSYQLWVVLRILEQGFGVLLALGGFIDTRTWLWDPKGFGLGLP